MAQPKSSKEKRAAQNKAARQAAAARKVNAHAEPGASGRAKAAPKRGGLRGLFNPTPTTKSTTGGAKATTGSGAPTARSARAAAVASQPPGHRAALSAVFASVAAVVLCLVAVPVAVNSDGDLYTRESLAVSWSITAAEASVEAPDATPAEIVKSIDEWTPGRETKPALIALWPWSLAVILPVLGSFFGFQAVRQRKPSKAVSRAMFLTVLGVLTTTQLAFLFLPSVVALAVAMYQVRKAEVAAASVAVGDATTGEVVEAQVIDDASEVEADADESDPT
jgi:hypothetical protein